MITMFPRTAQDDRNLRAAYTANSDVQHKKIDAIVEVELISLLAGMSSTCVINPAN